MFKRFYILRDEAGKGENGGGGSGYVPGTPPPPPPAAAPAPAASDDKKTEAKGNSGDPLSFYGQHAPPPPASDKTPASDDKSKQDPSTEPGASGYGVEDEVPPVEDKKDQPPAPPAEDDKSKEEYKDLNVEGLEAEYADKLKDFAAANKLTKEAAQAMVDLKKAELNAFTTQQAEAKKAHDLKVKQTRNEWRETLKKDPEFGGEHFLVNVQTVDKYLKDFLPETNKVLTTNKSMLPPYVVKDLFRLAKEAYKTDTFVKGDSPDMSTSSHEAPDYLSFYKNNK